MWYHAKDLFAIFKVYRFHQHFLLRKPREIFLSVGQEANFTRHIEFDVATDLLEKQVVCWVLLLYEKLEKKSYLIQNRNSNNDTLVQVYVFLLIFVTDTVT